MQEPQVNLHSSDEKKIRKGKKRIVSKLFFYPLIFIIIFITVFSFQVVFSGDSIMETISKINIFSNGLSLDTDKPLKGEAEDRINVLLLGMGGEGHPGPYLTDTIMLLSYKPSTNQVSMVSIPRDLSAPIPGYGWRKINYANHFGETQASGQGAEFASETISKIFDIPIHYYVRVDFSGFEKLIDELGGINIYVENSFVDNQFPTNDLGYQTLNFEQGWQEMDGQTALNYARSRHGNNGENSDFARSKRQQKVIQAAKDKALSFSTLLSYRKLNALYDLYKDNISTNVEPWEILKGAKLAKNIETENIINIVLNNGTDGPLYSTIINDAYILLPKDMSFFQLQSIVKYAFEPEKKQQALEPAKIEIQNGTKIEGLAYKTSLELKSLGYKVVKIGNAEKQTYEKTQVFDLTNGQNNEALEKIKEKLNAQINNDLDTAQITSLNNIDFLIILGQDQSQLSRID